MVTAGLLVTMQAKPGKEGELAEFLAAALPLAQAEPETTAWFAIKIDPSTFATADFFPAAAGRQAHLNGPIAAALIKRADELLASPPDIKPVDVLAAKLPASAIIPGSPSAARPSPAPGQATTRPGSVKLFLQSPARRMGAHPTGLTLSRGVTD